MERVPAAVIQRIGAVPEARQEWSAFDPQAWNAFVPQACSAFLPRASTAFVIRERILKLNREASERR